MSLTEDERAQRALNKANKKPEKVTIFRGIHFDEWLRVFMQASLRVVVKLSSTLTRNVFHSTRSF